jgi:hypothetical protein
VIAIEPDVARNHLELAAALREAGQLDASLQALVHTTTLDGVAEVHLRIADLLARFGRQAESVLAREAYQRLQLEDFQRGGR